MVGKLCAAPARGGSASGLIEYLVGYAISEKGATREEISDALDAVYIEAEARADLGVDVIWSPEAGGGTRPSSVLVRNCAAFSTASLEIDADAARNPGVRTGAMHFVWSWNTQESGKLTDEQVHTYVGKVLAKLNLGHHRSVSVVHRDTDNLHVHVAVGSVDPRLGLAYDRTGLHRRMAWAEREVELDHGLDHDHGLAVVQDAGLETAHVRWADVHELAAWRAERKEERLARQERRSFEGYRLRDGTFERYVDTAVGPRLQVALDLSRQRGRAPDWATLHAVAARYGCELDADTEGRVIVRDVGVGELRLAHDKERRELRQVLKARGIEDGEIEQRVAELRAEHIKEETSERMGKRQEGATVALRSVLPDDLRDMPRFQSTDEAERDVIERILHDPGIVLRDVTAQSSTFAREDVDLWLASRFSDPSEIERLGDRVVRHESVRMLSADTAQPLMTTIEVLAIEDRLDSDARVLASTASGITADNIRHAIIEYEAQESAKRGEQFELSSEQRVALEALARGSLVVMDGLPGVGKTTIQGAVRVLGEQTGKEVVGLTLSQAAAERLESEASFRCVNTARARILEEGHVPVIPQGGIVVVDEAAMVDSRANGRILQLARERGCLVLEIGDVRQLQPIDFGASFRIVREAAQGAGTYHELRDIQRQRREWHRDAVITLADAIIERDDTRRLALVRQSLSSLDEHGAIAWVTDRDEAIDAAVTLARGHQADGQDTITIASDKDSVRHLSEEYRRREGRQGVGLRYVTAGGTREFTAGDRLMFLENSVGKSGLGVRNGDRGEVIETTRDRIAVRIDGDKDRVIAFAPSAYRSFDYANASTVHKAQGASVDAAVSVVDRSASAELLFVAASRSKAALEIVVPRSAFGNIEDLAEHISERISLKTTSRTYDELLERTGGKETIRVRNIEAQREAAPLRRVYEADVVEPLRALQLERAQRARDEYRERKREITKSSMSIEERLEAGRDALRAMRKSVTVAYRELRPQAFGEWLQEREENRERIRATGANRHERQQEQSREQNQHAQRHGERGDFSRAETLARQAEIERER
jgi:hypothetical protein